MLARPSAATPATVVLPIVAFAVTSALMMTTVGALRYFWGSDDEYWVMFQDFTLIMLALLLVPLTTLGGAAARLSARRRDDRLATLRLLGATARTVALITVIESTALAVVGALGGIVLHAVTTPLLGLIHFHGAPFGPTALWAGPLGILGVLGGVALLAAVSAAIGLRSVVVSPLGVRQRQQAARVSWIRPVLGVVLIVVAFLAAVAGGAGAGIAVIVVAFGLAVGVLGIIGPWAIALFARRRLRVAKTAESLLAARSILESPKAAWRLVGGIAMTSFIAVVGGGGLALMDSIGSSSWEPTFVDDFRTGIFSTLLASFLMVACSVGVGQAAAVLDRRDLYVSLDRMGAPVATMDAARVRAVMSPLVFVTVGSSLLGAIIVLPLLGLATVIAPLSVVVIIACLVAGVALVRLSLLATRPVLTGVLAQAERPLG
ncbi:permease [Rathayibacter tanaceti]|nr:permease [Rathayibacter tanaceti]